MAVISVLAAGTRGDAQPPAMLCRELSRRGHEVRLIAQHEFADMIEGSDVSLKPLPGDLHAELSSPDAQKFFNGSGSPLTFLRWFYDVGKKFGDQLTPAMVDFTAGSDIVVGTGLADYFSNLMARVHKTKAAHAYMQPAVPTRASSRTQMGENTAEKTGLPSGRVARTTRTMRLSTAAPSHT